VSYNITLSSSMRSNLLSLRNIATQMSKTQNILSTGKKINNAIDNATSYYQARSLTHRAADLNSLLDSMSQGIQTIKAAVEGLESGIKVLEQLDAFVDKTIVENASNRVIYGDEVRKDISKYATVVSSANELINAINSNAETICVFGTIDLGEVNETININKNQKIVGVEYFGYNDSDVDKFSSIKATSSSNISLFQTNNVDCVFSDLTIEYSNNSEVCGENSAIMAIGGNLEINSMNVKFESIDKKTVFGRACVMGKKSAVINTSGVNYLEAKGSYGYGYRVSNSTLNMNGFDNITTNGSTGRGVVSVGGNVVVNNQVSIDCTKSTIDGFFYGTTQFSETSQVSIIDKNAKIKYLVMSGVVTFDKGAKFAFGTKEADLKYYEINQATNNSSTKISDFVIADYVMETNNFELMNDPDVNSIKDNINDELTLIDKPYSYQYQKFINTYNEIISDSSYQGVNLLDGNDLMITFNEDYSHKYIIDGVNAKSDKIGFSAKEWIYMTDVEATSKDIKEVVNNLRKMASELGNKLSIIQTRQRFTDTLVDVLEVGADKLVLADMNEVSAEYLTLQTRQQLAVNSLSLASQSASSILGLF